ncbi:MAG: VirK/YbjX family protein [Duganella sp.]
MLITLHSATAGLTGLRRLRDDVKLAARALLHRQAANRWLQLLNSSPLFADLVADHPRMVYKIFRPYFSNALGYAERVALLTEHYRFILRQGLGPLTALASKDKVVLARATGKGGLPYHIQLCAVEPMEREGELVLQLVQGAGPDELIVYHCAFSFHQGERGMVLGIGCMQGPRGEHGLQVIKDATRELHGLRPKSMMVKLLGQIGHALGCVELRLVGNANRTVCRSVRQGKVHADYDALWLELDATPRADGDYRLPCEPLAEPDLAAIASKKRSEARKRHDTLAGLADAIAASLQASRQPLVGSMGDKSAAPASERRDYALA